MKVVEGKSMQQYDGNWFVIEKGDIVVIPPNRIHASLPYDGHSAVIDVYQYKIEEMAGQNSSYSNRLLNTLEKKIVIDNPIKETTEFSGTLLDLLVDLESMVQVSKLSDQCFLHATALKITAEIIRVYANTDCDTYEIITVRAREALRQFFDYLDNNYMNKIVLSHIADEVGYSVPQFSRLIKSATGMTFIDYVNRYRIDVAVQMILDGESITAAAYTSGFSSISAFNRGFKKIKHKSPTGFMKGFNNNKCNKE